MWSIVALTYTFTSLRIAQTISNFFNVNFAIGSVSAGLLTIPSMIFKIGFTSADAPELFYWLQGEEVEWLQQLPLILTARIIFATLAFHVIVILVKTFISSPNLRSKSYNSLIPALHSLLSLLLLTQSRTTNIPLFLFFHLQLFALSSLSLSPSQISMTTFILAQTSFYALGNSNAISSVDLSNSYNGVAGYNVLAVGAMVLFVGQQTGPEKKRAWVKAERELLAGEVLSKEQAEKIALDSQPKSDAGLKDSYLTYFSLATLFTSGSLLAVQMACTALRTHLFIWTVFSPKYLYSMAWTLGYHFLVNLGLNGSLWYLRS
jgi:ethanolaminephosphotransferase